MLVANCQVRYGVPCRLGNQRCAGQVGIRKNYGELLASISRGHVGRSAAAGLERGRNLPQTLVACLVSIVIVVALEGIDVAQNKCQRSFVTACDSNLSGEIQIKEPSISQFCQSILER
jgi:hypothetical protein